MSTTTAAEVYRVVRNSEEQYSIWPAARELPSGWQATGFDGGREECLAHIDEVWTDMRPLSLRRALADAGSAPPRQAPSPAPSAPALVARLRVGEHPVEVVLRPEPSLERFRQALDHRYVHVRFTDTAGGTEIGMALAADDAIESSGADLTAGTGTVKLAGELVLDFQPVRCHVRIDLPSLAGSGRLEFR